MPLSLSSIVTGFTYTPPSSSIYTGVTTVSFAATYSGALLNFNAIWSFGDGTYHASTDTSTTHVYQTPGTYPATLVVFNTIEEYRNYLLTHGLSLSALPVSQEYLTFTQSVSVVNFVHDSISLSTPTGVLQSRQQITPFRISFLSSNNEIPVFQLYSQNSISQPWYTVDTKWGHLKPQWRFTDVYGNNVQTISPAASSVNTLVVNNGSLSAAPFNVNTSTLTVGTSGFVDFYYIDDMPATVTLKVTLDATNRNNTQEIEVVPSYANSKLVTTTSYTVSASLPSQLLITTNGLSSFTMEGTKWLNSLVPYVISICDAQGYVLRNYPINNSAGNTYPLTRFLESIDSNGVTFELPSAVFQRFDINGFDVGGYYAGFFQPLSAMDFTRLRVLATLTTTQLSSGIISLSGASIPFDILSYNDNFGIQVFNENFDMASTIKSYALQDTIAENNILFDKLIGQITGDINSLPESLGKSIYSKIANFADSHIDIDKCNIDKLYSLCQELSIPIEDYNLDYPANLKRILNILSISYSRLKGSRELFNKDFIPDVTINSAKNLGAQLDTTTYQITAGVDIVVNEKFTNIYEIIHTVPLNNISSYSILSLSAFNYKTPLDSYYKFYTYVPFFTDNQVEGVINWGDPMTTLTEGVSSIDVWFGQSGLTDAIIDYQLRRGLELINN